MINDSLIKDVSDKTILELETLSKQYNIILKQYEQNIADYLSYLQEKNTTDTLISIKGQSYWGTKPLSLQQSSTLGKCKILCSTTENCTGATYDSTSSQCFLRSGESETIPSSENYYAIVSKNIFYLTTLQNLNTELTTINSKILEYINSGYKIYNIINKDSLLQKKNLTENYYKLAEERKIINQQMQEFETITESISLSNLKTNANYYSYLLLLFLAIFFIVMLIKYSVSKK
jgi:hypothetical protein